jgi:hypothetical protein
VTHEEHFQNVLRYEKNLINALKQEYKGDLLFIVRHDDEKFKGIHANMDTNEGKKRNEEDQTIEGEIHYHWHFFCVKEPGEKFDLHPGLLEREKHNISRKEKKELSADEIKKKYYDGRKAYRVAMVAYQDRMYELTHAKEYGIERYGERRLRRSRKEQKDLEIYTDKIIQTAQNQADEDRRKAEAARKQADEDRRRAEEARKQAEAAKRQADEIINQAEKDAKKTKDDAWKVARDIVSGANEILEKSRNFVNMLLDKISTLPGGVRIVKWARTFIKPAKKPDSQSNEPVRDNTQNNTQGKSR